MRYFRPILEPAELLPLQVAHEDKLGGLPFGLPKFDTYPPRSGIPGLPNSNRNKHLGAYRHPVSKILVVTKRLM